MPLTLTTDCPSQATGETYALNDYQLVTLTATLDEPGADIAEGTLVCFAGVASSGQQLQPYGTGWVPAPPPNENSAVGVKLSKVSGYVHRWQAQLVVLVAGLVPGSGTTYAYIDQTQYRSSDLDYTCNEVACVAPCYVDVGLTDGEAGRSSDFWLRYSEQDQSPDKPGNNYLYYRFQVTSPENHIGLRNICVRVSSSIETPGLILGKRILLYKSYSGWPALNGDPAYENDYVDLETDENGVAELYLCPKGKTSSIGALAYKIGTNEGALGPYLIDDPNAQWSTLKAPQTDNPVQLSGSIEAFAVIPRYENIAPDQWLFLLCNGRFQSSKRLTRDDIDNNADITMHFQKSVLRSITAPYDDATQNSMVYVVYGPDIRRSSNWNFGAVGMPPAAGSGHDDNPQLMAPQLCESPDGWPINAALLSTELHIRVPLDQPQILRGDEIRIHIYLNAFRRNSDEPLGIGFGGPFNLYVTQFDIDQGFIEWPFATPPFWGFGQEQSTGDVGTMRVNYEIARGTQFEIKRIVNSSQDLLLGIDTILPNGYTAEVF